MVYINKNNKTEQVMKKYPYVRKFFNEAHGSGVNYDWFAEETPTNIRLYNSFDAYTENGMLDARVNFVVLIPKKKPLNFKLQYRDSKSRYYANKYQLTEYLDDLFYEVLSEAVNSQKKNSRKR